MVSRILFFAALASNAAIACVIGPMDLEGYPCPCLEAQGYTCCHSKNVCVRHAEYSPEECKEDNAGDAAIDAPGLPDGSTDSGADVPEPEPDTGPEWDTPLCNGKGGTVRATYYADPLDLSVPTATNIERGFSFDWGTGGPAYIDKTDDFVVYLTGDLTPEEDGNYTFVLSSDDGSRLSIDGEVLIDTWGMGPLPDPFYARGAEKFLQSGRSYRVQVEYQEEYGDAFVDLQWKPPSSGSESSIAACLLTQADAHESPCDPAYVTYGCVPRDVPFCGFGGGLRVDYYFNRYRNQPFFELVNTEGQDGLWFNFDFLLSARTDHYSVRWQGYIEPPLTGDYTFYVASTTFVRLWVGGVETNGNNEEGIMGEGTMIVPLIAGNRHFILMEAEDVIPDHQPFVQVRWQSDSVPKSSIVPCRLSPPE